VSDEEVVWTTRRALLHVPGRAWTPGRLRVSDRAVRFTGHDGAVVEVAREEVTAVRIVGRPRRALLLETPEGPLRVRCFALPAVAALLQR
jgi:hypothetical protein